MIPNLKPYELNEYLNRITEAGIDGLGGIEKFQAVQLSNWLSGLCKKERDFADMRVAINPNYQYPTEYQNGNESLFWLKDSDLTKYLKALGILDQYLGIESNQFAGDNKEESGEQELIESDLHQKIESYFDYLLFRDNRKHKYRLSQAEFDKLINWIYDYFDNDLTIPEILDPIKKVNTIKGNIVTSFKEFFKSVYPNSPYPDSLYELIKACFYEYRMDKISNIKKTKSPENFDFDTKRDK